MGNQNRVCHKSMFKSIVAKNELKKSKKDDETIENIVNAQSFQSVLIVHYVKNADLNIAEVREEVLENDIAQNQENEEVHQNRDDVVVAVEVDQNQKNDHDRDKNLAMTMNQSVDI